MQVRQEGELTKREIRIVKNYLLKRDFDLWWWELERSDKGVSEIYADDIADYGEFLKLMERRQKMKADMARQKAEKEKAKT